MVKKEIITKLIDSKKAAILQVMLNSKEELCLKEVADQSNVPMASAFRILKDLISLEIIDKREWKTSKVYFCPKNDKVEFLKDLFIEEYDGINHFVSLIADVSQIDNIIMHGVRKKGKANILLIGESITDPKVEEAAQAVKSKGFDLSYLALTKLQYAQMAKMGLYPGEKKVLK
jgi:hypothetical protein